MTPEPPQPGQAPTHRLTLLGGTGKVALLKLKMTGIPAGSLNAATPGAAVRLVASAQRKRRGLTSACKTLRKGLR